MLYRIPKDPKEEEEEEGGREGVDSVVMPSPMVRWTSNYHKKL